MSPEAQAEATLIEAFPSLDSKVVKAVLVASGGKLEPAFNALLGMRPEIALREFEAHMICRHVGPQLCSRETTSEAPATVERQRPDEPARV